VVDLGGGHGLLAQVMLILDDSSPDALVMDKKLPASCAKIRDALKSSWPRLDGRIAFCEGRLEDVELRSTDIVVSSHACGELTDVVLERAAAARARVAVLPCCHRLSAADAVDLAGWVDGAVAIDVARALHLRGLGYSIRTQAISSDITPKNRLLIGAPII
jgi:hypothetical protein